MTVARQKIPLFPEGFAFVAGGSGGVGSAACLALAEAGCDVALTYRTNATKAEEVAQQIRATGRRAEVMQLDLEDAEAARKALLRAAELTEHGLHTVVYATGPMVPLKFLSQVTP
jgi:3-oxoacyl-[acyl-carrier protein] reductase